MSAYRRMRTHDALLVRYIAHHMRGAICAGRPMLCSTRCAIQDAWLTLRNRGNALYVVQYGLCDLP
eukprot:4512831-Pyramimonas_sp.AAC.1